MSLEDTLTRRQVFVLRYATSSGIHAADKLEEILNDITARLARESDILIHDRLANLRNDIRTIIDAGFVELQTQLTDNVVGMAKDEAAFTTKALQGDTAVILQQPIEAQILQTVFNAGMDTPVGTDTLTMKEAIAKFSRNKSTEVMRVISDGILNGQTRSEISKNLGTAIKGRTKAQVESLTRTLVINAQSQARNAITTDNSDILKGEEWVATLDSRTTLICAGRDGRIYPVGKGPFPPAHWNCRSIRVPVIKDEFNLDPTVGKRPEVAAKGRGQTSANTKFDSWLRRQPAGFQDEYFSQFPDGKEKALLFRNGKLPIQQFRDETGRNFTLQQLKDLHPSAFQKANI